MDDADIPQLPPESQLFLQAVISRRMLTEKTATKLYKRCCTFVDVEYSTQRLQAVVTQIQSALDPIGLTYIRRIDPYTGKPWHAIINITQDELAKTATEYAPEEVRYYKYLVKSIMEAPNQSFAIPQAAALRAPDGTENNEPQLTKLTRQKLCSSFVARGWLFKTNKGFYTLGNRALMELDTYLRNDYSDIFEDAICKRCKELVTKGSICATKDCSCKFHDHCLEAWLKFNPKCPECEVHWKGDPIGEDAVQLGNSSVLGGADADADDYSEDSN